MGKSNPHQAKKKPIRPKVAPSVRREAWKNQFFHQPVLRDPNPEIERHSTWLESFFDLAFAAAVGSLALELGKTYDLDQLARFVLLFTPILWCWIGQTFYLTRFDANDMWQRLFAVMQMGCVGFMAIFGAKPLQESAVAFAIAYIGCRLILIIQYVRTAQYIGKAWAYCMGMAYGFSFAVLLWVISIFVPEPFRYGFWAVGILIDFSTPQLLAKHNAYLKVHAAHVPERFGLLVLIMISEIFVTQISALASEQVTWSTLSLAAITFMIAVATWWDYFEAVGGADARRMDDANSMKAFRTWMYLHFPYGAGLIMVSGLSRYGILHGAFTRLNLNQTTVYVFTLLLILVTPLFLWYSLPHHFGKKEDFRIGYRYLYQMILAIPFAAGAYYWGVFVGLAGIFLIYLLRFVLQMRDMYLREYFEIAAGPHEATDAP